MTERIGKQGPCAGRPSEKSSPRTIDVTEDRRLLEETKRPLRILVAEDTRAFQELVLAILGQRGHRIEIVGNGFEAVDRVQQTDFDVVLMDLNMPMMNGLEAAAAIRRDANARRATVPIIAITAHTWPSNRENCLSAGMDDYLAKPFDSAELVRIVEWCGSRRQPPGDPLGA